MLLQWCKCIILVTVWSVTVIFNLMVFNIIIWLISPYRLQFPHTDYSHAAHSVTDCAASGGWHPPGVNTFNSHCPFPLKLQFLSVLTEPEQASWSRPWTCKLYIHMYVHGRDWLSSHAPHSNGLCCRKPGQRPSRSRINGGRGSGDGPSGGCHGVGGGGGLAGHDLRQSVHLLLHLEAEHPR